MKSKPLRLDYLEVRDVPAIFGTPWPVADFLTVSFAPDGSDVQGVPSSLFDAMSDAGMATTQWQGEILRAIQTWTTNAKMNVGVVTDDGSKMGASGSLLRDSRFGDIRIFARPLSDNVLAITCPPGNDSGTAAGDIILNSNFPFGIGAGAGRDLYSVMLQEVGHSLGIANSADPASPMYETYSGVRTGLTADDIKNLQDMYGSRGSYYFQELFGNNSSDRATTISRPADVAATTTLGVWGDLSSTSDVDWYTFSATDASPLTVQLRVNGSSLLRGRINVYDASLKLLGSATSTAVGGDAEFTVKSPVAGAKYFVQIDDVQGTAFSTGTYRLRLSTSSSAPEYQSMAGTNPFDDKGMNDVIDKASTLYDMNSTSEKTGYTIFGGMSSTTDVDYLKVRTPAGATNQTVTLKANVIYFAGKNAPSIEVYNTAKKLVPATVVANGLNTYVVQLNNATADSEYYLKISGQPGMVGPGVYQLTVEGSRSAANHTTIATGTLSKNATETFGTLSVGRSVTMNLRLSATGKTSNASTTMTMYNAFGIPVFSLTARAGDTVSGNVLLISGDYSIRYSRSTSNGNVEGVSFKLEAVVITDPIGVLPSDPNVKTVTPPPDYSYSVKPPATYRWLTPAPPVNAETI